MGEIFEFIAEVVLEIIFDGLLKKSRGNKVVRFLCLVLFFAFFLLLAVLLFPALHTIHVSLPYIAFVIGMTAFAVCTVKWLRSHEKRD